MCSVYKNHQGFNICITNQSGSFVADVKDTLFDCTIVYDSKTARNLAVIVEDGIVNPVEFLNAAQNDHDSYRATFFCDAHVVVVGRFSNGLLGGYGQLVLGLSLQVVQAVLNGIANDTRQRAGQILAEQAIRERETFTKCLMTLKSDINYLHGRVNRSLFSNIDENLDYAVSQFRLFENLLGNILSQQADEFERRLKEAQIYVDNISKGHVRLGALLHLELFDSQGTAKEIFLRVDSSYLDISRKMDQIISPITEAIGESQHEDAPALIEALDDALMGCVQIGHAVELEERQAIANIVHLWQKNEMASCAQSLVGAITSIKANKFSCSEFLGQHLRPDCGQSVSLANALYDLGAQGVEAARLLIERGCTALDAVTLPVGAPTGTDDFTGDLPLDILFGNGAPVRGFGSDYRMLRMTQATMSNGRLDKVTFGFEEKGQQTSIYDVCKFRPRTACYHRSTAVPAGNKGGIFFLAGHSKSFATRMLLSPLDGDHFVRAACCPNSCPSFAGGVFSCDAHGAHYLREVVLANGGARLVFFTAPCEPLAPPSSCALS